MQRVFSFTAIAVLLSISSAVAQTPDESDIVKNRDWDGMLKIAQASGNADLAKRKYLEAWNFAHFWAVYNPADRDSGSKRADGIRGMRMIRMAGAAAGLDDTFRQLDAILAENPPKVFSGGAKNEGVWRDDANHIWTVKQNGGRFTGRFEDDDIIIDIEGREFNGTTMQIETTMKGKDGTGPTIRLTGQVTFDGNRITGKLRNPMGGTNQFELIRTWRE